MPDPVSILQARARQSGANRKHLNLVGDTAFRCFITGWSSLNSRPYQTVLMGE